MRKILLWSGAAAVIAIGVAAAWFGRDAYATARLGATYVAKQTCSCLFVAKRSPESCRTDYDANDLAGLTVAPDANGVRVSALGGLFSGRAEHAEGFGCHPVE